MPADRTSSVFFSALFNFGLFLFLSLPLLLHLFFPDRTYDSYYHPLSVFLFLVLDLAMALGTVIIEDIRTCHIRRADLVCLGILVWAWHGLSYLSGLMSIRHMIRLFLLDSWTAAGPFLVLYLISGGRWLGFSDVCLMWVIGFWLGWRDGFLVLWLGCVLTLILLPLFPCRYAHEWWKLQMPLGPGIAGMAVLWGWTKEGRSMWLALCSMMRKGGGI